MQQRREEWNTKENKGKLHDASIVAAVVGEKASLGTEQRNQANSPLSIVKLCLAEGISQSGSQIMENSVQ